MTLAGCLIAQVDERWRVHVGDQSSELPADASNEEICDAVLELKQKSKISSLRCVIAPSSSTCYFVRVPDDQAVDVGNSSEMLFLVEDRLPYDAEELVADFRTVTQTTLSDSTKSSEVSGICTRHALWRDLIEDLENCDVQVISIVPQAVLIARGIGQSVDATNGLSVMVASDLTCEAISFDRNGIRQWKNLPLESGAISRHLRVNNDELPSLLIGDDASITELQNAGIKADVLAEDSSVFMLAGADVIFASRWGKWPDLRRGALAPGDPLRPIASQLRNVAIAGVLFLVAIFVAAWIRTERIDDKIAELSEQQRQAYQDAFPDSKVPIMLMRHVRREHKKAVGSRGGSKSETGNRAIDVPVSATDVLASMLRSLPNDVRFRLIDMDIQNGECRLTVRVRDSADVGKVASALESGGFQVSPPATQRMEESRDEEIVTFQSVITAVWGGES